MLPTKALRLKIGTALAADATSLAPAADANVIALVKEVFAENENLEVGELDLADFDGSTPIEGVVGAQQTGVDPLSGQQVITIIDPEGGYRFITTGLTNLPQTIYGFALLTNSLGTLLATKLLDEPITLSVVGQEINIGKAQLSIVLRPVS